MFSMLLGIVFAVGSEHAQKPTVKPIETKTYCTGLNCQPAKARFGLFKRWKG